MASKTPALAVLGSGMVTAAGFDARATCAAIRAGVSGARQDNIWDPGAGAYMKVGRPRTPQWWEGADMLSELAAPAVLEAMGALPERTDPASVPIFVLVSPADRPHREVELEHTVLNGLIDRLPFAPHRGSVVLRGGRTALLSACTRAGEMLAEGAAKHAVVVGVDTFLRQRVVDSFMRRRRVLTEDNSNGFIPGEAACAVLLGAAGSTPGGELRIIGMGQGREKGHIDGEKPLSGEGLITALRGALDMAGIKLADTQYWLTDQNAEHYKAKECTLAQIRLERRKEPAVPPFRLWNPIESLGEIGSAIGPCLLGVALAAARKGYAPGPLALLSVGEDDGERAAMVLQWRERN